MNWSQYFLIKLTKNNISNGYKFWKKFRIKMHNVKDALSKHNSEYQPTSYNASDLSITTIVHCI